MAKITVKIVGVDGESVLVKYASENSLKSIDKYEAVAYQPRLMGYNTVEEFIEGIKPSLLALAEARDLTEKTNLDLNSWKNYEKTVDVSSPELFPVIPPATEAQIIETGSEVIL